MLDDEKQPGDAKKKRSPKIDYDLPPEDFFFTPGRDKGIYRVGHEAPRLVFRDPAHVRGFPLSAFDLVNGEIEKALKFARNTKMASKVVTIPSPIVLLEDVLYQDSFRSIGGKWLLTGASGTRLRNRHAMKNPAEGRDRHAKVSKFLVDHRPGCHLPAYGGEDLQSDLPFVIECRNRFNYFHFLTETMCQLCAAAEAPTDGPIIIHYPGGKSAPFTDAFVRALFPDIAHRVTFTDLPARYDRALASFELDHFLFQAEDGALASVDPVMPHNWAGTDRKPGPQSQAILAQNSVSEDLLKLRERAHALVAEGNYDHLPTRFWVARSSSGARDRSMKNENKLVRKLEKMGFSTVYFEHLSPLEQVAIMARAEMMISYHGAGYANMIFAGKDTHVIEIGHLQTAIYRWNDFTRLAHVAGCKYTSFFADFYKPDPELIPEVRHNNLLPVAISDASIDQLIGFLANALGEKRRRMADPDLIRLATRLNDTKEWAGLRKLLQDNWESVENHPTLLVHMANCAGAEDDVAGMQSYLDKAWALDPSRPILLERLIKVSRRRKDWPRAQRLLMTHKKLFPERDKDFTGQRLERPN